MFIIHLHAKHPDTKAAMNPTANGSMSMPPKTSSPFTAFITSSNASPNIGGITIRNENCASDSFLLPSSKPVAIVLPERERPGITAHACAKPIIKASFRLIFSF